VSASLPVPAAEVLERLPLLTRLARKDQALLLLQMEQLVRVESPSRNKAACDQAGSLAAECARALGARVRMVRHREYGNSLVARFGGAGLKSKAPVESRAGRQPLLLLGHLDTVWPEGTLRTMPFRRARERISGPGVLDMKAGVAMAFAAIRILREADAPMLPVTLLLHCDEEIGSPASRTLTESMARGMAAVYVLEPAQGVAGAYKTARKGVGHYRLAVQGVAAHSGVDFSSGHSAVVELARQITGMAALSGSAPGLTVNPGVMGGGTLANVVAAEAWAEIDVRIARAADGPRIEQRLRRLKAFDRTCELTLTGGINRPPMERTAAIARLFAKARACAGGMGFELEEAATGGGSDGNFTAALGVPTLDGMGAVGAGAHAPHEHILRSHLAPRTALLAALCMA
jgi:glutamate carboxypeptidase